jgi:hypothetical protein
LGARGVFDVHLRAESFGCFVFAFLLIIRDISCALSTGSPKSTPFLLGEFGISKTPAWPHGTTYTFSKQTTWTLLGRFWIPLSVLISSPGACLSARFLNNSSSPTFAVTTSTCSNDTRRRQQWDLSLYLSCTAQWCGEGSMTRTA